MNNDVPFRLYNEKVPDQESTPKYYLVNQTEFPLPSYQELSLLMKLF